MVLYKHLIFQDIKYLVRLTPVPACLACKRFRFHRAQSLTSLESYDIQLVFIISYAKTVKPTKDCTCASLKCLYASGSYSSSACPGRLNLATVTTLKIRHPQSAGAFGEEDSSTIAELTVTVCPL